MMPKELMRLPVYGGTNYSYHTFANNVTINSQSDEWLRSPSFRLKTTCRVGHDACGTYFCAKKILYHANILSRYKKVDDWIHWGVSLILMHSTLVTIFISAVTVIIINHNKIIVDSKTVVNNLQFLCVV